MTNAPGEDRGPTPPPRHVEVRGGWDWGSGWGWSWDGSATAPGVPWLGLVLIALGVLFLANDLVPAFRVGVSLVFLVLGVGLLLTWLVRRQRAALYAGAVLTGLALPAVLRDLGVIAGGGWTELSLGIAFLAVALIRYVENGGWGWQAWIGLVLVLVGAGNALPELSRLGWPVLLVVVGGAIVLRGLATPRGPRRRSGGA